MGKHKNKSKNPQQVQPIQQVQPPNLELIINVMKEREHLIQENQHLIKENTEIRGQLGISNALLENERTKKSKYDEEMNILKKDNEDLKLRVTNLEIENETLIKENKSLREENNALRKENDELRRRIVKIEEENIELKEKVGRLINEKIEIHLVAAIQDANGVYKLENSLGEFAESMKDFREDRNTSTHYIYYPKNPRNTICRKDSDIIRDYKSKILLQKLRDPTMQQFTKKIDHTYGQGLIEKICETIEKKIIHNEIPIDTEVQEIIDYWKYI